MGFFLEGFGKGFIWSVKLFCLINSWDGGSSLSGRTNDHEPSYCIVLLAYWCGLCTYLFSRTPNRCVTGQWTNCQLLYLSLGAERGLLGAPSVKY